MESKQYRLGLVVGRFQIIHAGHEEIINRAVDLCDVTGVFIGSSQESGTAKNPLSYEYRRDMLRDIFGDSICVCPLPDLGAGNNSTWGQYVVQNVYEQFSSYPDLFVSGEEERRADWFPSEMFPYLSQIYIPKSIDISASRMRSFLIENRYDCWKEFSNPCIWNRYSELREAVIKSLIITDTSSI